ncbi:MFS transporter [Symbiopectobacterium sp.]|uniref:MFS transporter n=1 Tax=Symbiopectobacterium sp. TaxID=2952789 RepID=UPI003F36BCEB
MSSQQAQTGLSLPLTLIMSTATGLAVASNYYAQPLLETIARAFELSVNQAGLIVTAAQVGYAVGLMFLVPMGDMFERRTLIVTMTLLTALGLVITALAPTLPVMLAGIGVAGLCSVVAQLLVPLAATLATPETRGKVVGTIMSGLLLGILLARTIAGALATLGGWRTVYWVASVLMVIMALVLWRALPRLPSSNNLQYEQLIVSIFRLFASTPVLRVRALLGCLSFANFSILWTSMAFLLSAPPYHYSEGIIGLFGLVGAAGALAATRAGRLVDKGKATLTTTVGLVLLLLSWGMIAMGATSLLPLIVGIVVLDLAVQGLHVTNQSVIYQMMPEARNRLTAGYMTSYFIGGAAGSLLSAATYQVAGWAGVCYAGAAVSLLMLLIWIPGRKHG